MALFGAIVFAAPAHASEWWFVSLSGDSPDRRVLFIDTESAVSDGTNRIKVWSYRIYEKINKDGRRKEKFQTRFDCSARTMTLLALNLYGNNDRFIDSLRWDSYEQEVRDVVPDTIGEEQWTFVCRNSSSTALKIDNSPEEFAATIFRGR
jgi:hypothetical protein